MTPRSLRPIRPGGPDGWRAGGAPLITVKKVLTNPTGDIPPGERLGTLGRRLGSSPRWRTLVVSGGRRSGGQVDRFWMVAWAICL
jgi:hypothetical protein